MKEALRHVHELSVGNAELFRFDQERLEVARRGLVGANVLSSEDARECRFEPAIRTGERRCDLRWRE